MGDFIDQRSIAKRGVGKIGSLVTIITSTLNAAGTIKHLISSLRAQSTNDFQWIVADGGSTDQTLDLLKDADDIVSHLLLGPDFGIYDGLNRAIGFVKTPYYLVVGADDLLDPDAICILNKAAEVSNSDFISGLVRTSSGSMLLPMRGNAFRYGHLAYVSQHSVGTLIKTDLHKKVGLYSNRFPIAADRHFILTAIEQHGASVDVLNATLGTYAMTGTSSAQLHNALLDILKVDYELSKHPLGAVLKSIIRYALYIPRLVRRR